MKLRQHHSTAWLIHELVQPLATLQLLADVMAQTPDAQRQAERISQQVARISAIMRHAREQHLKLHREPVSVSTLIHETLEMVDLQPYASLRLEVDIGRAGDDLILADCGLIEQVLLNLIRNAREAGGDHIILRTTRFPTAIEIAVLDNGPGIAPAIADRLFQPHVTTKQSGMGVGLAISREIVESDGGTLTWHRTDENYTRFVIRLPL